MPYFEKIVKYFIPKYKLLDKRYIEYQHEPYWQGDDIEGLIRAIPYYMGESRCTKDLVILELVSDTEIKYKTVPINLFIQ